MEKGQVTEQSFAIAPTKYFFHWQKGGNSSVSWDYCLLKIKLHLHCKHTLITLISP